MPAWTADATDQAYQEIGFGSALPIPKDIVLDAKVDQPEIGRWGELLVHNYLLQQQEGSVRLLLFGHFHAKNHSVSAIIGGVTGKS